MKEIQVTCLCRSIRLADVGIQLTQGQVHYLPITARNSPEVANAQRARAIRVEVVERFKERRPRVPEKAKGAPRAAPPPYQVMVPPTGKTPSHPQTVVVKEYKTDINTDQIAQTVQGTVAAAVVRQVRTTMSSDLRIMLDGMIEDLAEKVGDIREDLTVKVGAVQDGLAQQVAEIQKGFTARVEEGLTGVRQGMVEDVKGLLEKLPRLAGGMMEAVPSDVPAFIPETLMTGDLEAEVTPTESSTKEFSVDEATEALRAAKARNKKTEPEPEAPKKKKPRKPVKKATLGKKVSS